MKNLNNRRDFLKKMGTIAGLTQLPLMGWAEGFSALLSEGVNPSGEFSLLKLENLLSGYQYPVAEKFTTDSFSSGYKLYNLYGGNAVFGGEFFLKSEIKGKNRLVDFSIWRMANSGIKKNQIPEFKYIVSGKVECKSDATLTPEKWKVCSRIATSEDGPAFTNTGLLNEGAARNGEVINKISGRQIKKSFGSMPLSWKWGLVAVVQNMSESSVNELQFATLDEFDAIHENQKIRLLKNVKIDCGKDLLIDFKVFELSGDGVLPTVYWVDNKNRTLFVISGMEAFVLKA